MRKASYTVGVLCCALASIIYILPCAAIGIDRINELPCGFVCAINKFKSLVTRKPEDLQMITKILRDNLQDISASNVPPSHIDSMAFLIHDSMTASSRFFHTPNHIFGVAKGMNSIETLAVLFHDVIYYIIDGGLSDTQQEILSDVIVEDKIEGSVRANNADGFHPTDSVVLMVMSVFGFQPGQVLKVNEGMNEFLSAVVAAKSLEGYVSKTDLLRIVACIEATIPFRASKQGETSGDDLFEKIQITNAAFQIGMSEAELIGATHLGTEVANRDVENFSHGAAEFLGNTWCLMSESNVPLRDVNGGAIQVSEFAIALNKMRLFFGYLQPEVVFHQFKGIPNDVKYTDLEKRAGENINIGKKYMEYKFLFASFMVSMSVLTGGDSPLSIWVFNPHLVADTQEDWRELLIWNGVGVDSEVHSMLTNPVGCETPEFNILNSATAQLLYSPLGDDGVINACEHAAKAPTGKEGARAFLDVLPRQSVHHLLKAFSKSGGSERSEALTKLAVEYSV